MAGTEAPEAPEAPVERAPAGSRLLRGLGWTLITAGALVLLYLVYLLWFTGFETDRQQQQLLEQWSLQVGDVEAVLPGESAAGEGDGEESEEVAPGDAYAAIRFERPGSDEPLVQDGTLFVVEGVSLGDLRRGPGHYPQTDVPGGDGNFAISGHRTTWSAPFYDLDDLQPGDLVHVVDRDGVEWTYEVREQRVVQPTDVWVIGDDPLGTGAPLMTITTCHPRFSDAQRLIVFAELVDA